VGGFWRVRIAGRNGSRLFTFSISLRTTARESISRHASKIRACDQLLTEALLKIQVDEV
jgi:hypothetical protein